MQLSIASASDVPDLVNLLAILFDQETEFAPDTDAQARGLTKIVANSEVGFIMTAKENERIIGMVNVLFTVSTALGERVGILEDMVVLPIARRDGAGSALLKGAIERARELGCKRLTLLTDRDNLPAHRFYERHGFAISEMVPFRLSLE